MTIFEIIRMIHLCDKKEKIELTSTSYICEHVSHVNHMQLKYHVPDNIFVYFLNISMVKI